LASSHLGYCICGIAYYPLLCSFNFHKTKAINAHSVQVKDVMQTKGTVAASSCKLCLAEGSVMCNAPITLFRTTENILNTRNIIAPVLKNTSHSEYSSRTTNKPHSTIAIVVHPAHLDNLPKESIFLEIESLSNSLRWYISSASDLLITIKPLFDWFSDSWCFCRSLVRYRLLSPLNLSLLP